MTREKRVCLAALATLHDVNPDGFWPFAPIMRHAQLPRPILRRCIRALARAELAEFAAGLYDEDGNFRGAGYRCTERGLLVAATQEAEA